MSRNILRRGAGVLLFFLAQASGAWAQIEGYAGPGWCMLAGREGFSEMTSLGPVMFKAGKGRYLGPQIAYEESSAEGPGIFLGGIKAEFHLASLSAGSYSTSLTASLMGGAAKLGSDAEASLQAALGLDANLLLTPSLVLSAGPVAALRWSPDGFALLPGLAFSLKEGTTEGEARPVLDLEAKGLRIGGYWQGLWLFMDGRGLFIDGGGTRLVLPSGLAFGITGGVLRQKIEGEGSVLSIMQSGLTAEWNHSPLPFLTLTPRVMSGLHLCGWFDDAGTMDGGAFFIVRPELSLHLGILPFLELGGGLGYALLLGDPAVSKPLPELSGLAISILARVGERRPRQQD